MPRESSAQKDDLIPRKILFGNSDKTAVKLSHDGSLIAYLAPFNGVMNVWVAPSNDISQARAITYEKERGIQGYSFAYDNEHLLFFKDDNGDENFRIYSYSLLTKKMVLLTPKKGVQADLLEMSERMPQNVIIGINNRDKRYFDVYNIDLKTGEKHLLLENNKFSKFIMDRDLNIRFGIYINKEAEHEYHEHIGNNQWNLFMKFSGSDAENSDGMFLDSTGNILYLRDSRDRDTAALKSVEIKTRKEHIMAWEGQADIKIMTLHPMTHMPEAITVEYDKPKIKVLNNAINRDLEYLKTLARGKIAIKSRSLDDKHWLVMFEADDAPKKYFKYDRKQQKAQFLFTNKAELEKHRLLPMHSVIIKARDGLSLVSYITFPKNTKLDNDLRPNKPLPLVLFVHGGPWSRDYFGLNETHQWLADRGYAVLSVNYRGSTGFGKNFSNAGNKQWGQKMQDDLTDAVNWAIQNNIADRRKVAIMGRSYGGYAALAGMVFTPELYACGIDVYGPSNVVTLLKTIPPYWTPLKNTFKKRIGDWENPSERKAIENISPLNFVDRIKRPLFIAQGANDARVNRLESDRVASAMKSKNIPFVYIVYNDEGHGFVRAENRLSYYAFVEQFLSEHLGGKAEPVGDDLKGANFTTQRLKAPSFMEGIIGASSLVF